MGLHCIWFVYRPMKVIDISRFAKATPVPRLTLPRNSCHSHRNPWHIDPDVNGRSPKRNCTTPYGIMSRKGFVTARICVAMSLNRWLAATSSWEMEDLDDEGVHDRDCPRHALTWTEAHNTLVRKLILKKTRDFATVVTFRQWKVGLNVFW
jgi:hypothetical protein